METGFYYHLLSKGKLKEEDIEPDIEPFQVYMDAFVELSSCRVNTMSMGPIPFTAIVEYFKLLKIGEDFEEFLYLIRRMDNKMLSLESEKMKREREARPK